MELNRNTTLKNNNLTNKPRYLENGAKSTCRPNFGEISQSAAEILLLPNFEIKRPPCWNLLSVLIFTYASSSACHSVFAYQISSKSYRSPWSYEVVAAVSQYWIFSRATADHPRGANEGLRLILKFRLDPICSFWDIAIFMLWGFGLKWPIFVVVSSAHGQN